MRNWLYTLVTMVVALTIPGVATAADLGNTGGRAYVEAPVVAKDWTGIYAGFLVGWSTADFEYDSTTTVGSTTVPFGFGSSGDEWNFGAQLGGDYQYGSIVVGGVVDFSYMGQGGGGTVDLGEEFDGPEDTFLLDHEFGLEYLATARFRAGVLVHPLVLAYVTGGVAFGNVEFDARARLQDGETTVGSLNFGSDTMRWGYTVGAGLEAKLTENIRAKVEYLYVDLGEAEYNINAISGSTELGSHNGSLELDLHVVRAGLAYQF